MPGLSKPSKLTLDVFRKGRIASLGVDRGIDGRIDRGRLGVCAPTG